MGGWGRGGGGGLHQSPIATMFLWNSDIMWNLFTRMISRCET